jgi:hypothetical protein
MIVFCCLLHLPSNYKNNNFTSEKHTYMLTATQFGYIDWLQGLACVVTELSVHYFCLFLLSSLSLWVTLYQEGVI